MMGIRRRTFLVSIGALFAAPLLAQQSTKVYRIGLLLPGGSKLLPLNLASLLSGLRDLGYIDGQNIIVEQRIAGGSGGELDKAAAELVRLRVDVILAVTTPAAQAARRATSTIPIVFVAIADPVGAGLVPSLGRPDRNITGLSTLAPEVSGKRLQLLLEVVPKLSRLAILANPTNTSNALLLRDVEDAARMLEVQTFVLEVRTSDEIGRSVEAAVQNRAGALMVMDDPLLFAQRARIAELAQKHRLPTICGFRETAEAGVLMAYGASLPAQFRRAATYIDRVFKGASPGELPVEQPTKFELIINMKTARALHLSIPSALLLQADGVIQ